MSCWCQNMHIKISGLKLSLTWVIMKKCGTFSHTTLSDFSPDLNWLQRWPKIAKMSGTLWRIPLSDLIYHCALQRMCICEYQIPTQVMHYKEIRTIQWALRQKQVVAWEIVRFGFFLFCQPRLFSMLFLSLLVAVITYPVLKMMNTSELIIASKVWRSCVW